MAPEILTRGPRGGPGGYGPAADVWSCGIILYKYLSGGHLPFTGETASDVFRAIRRNEVSHGTHIIIYRLHPL